MDCRPESPAIFVHLELVLKVQPRRAVTGSFRFLPAPEGSVRSRRKRTLLSFQRPALLGDVKKPPTRARGPGMLGTCFVSDCVLRALQCRGVRNCPTPPYRAAGE